MTTTTAAPMGHRIRTRVLLGGFVGVAMLGGAHALYGPSIPAFQRSFAVGVAAAGLALPFHATASFVGVSLWGALERRFAAGPVLAASAVTFAAGALGVAAAPTLVLALTGVAVLGLGFGALMNGVNTLLARDRRPAAPALLNALHAVFGVGAVLLPVVLSVVGFRLSFALVALGALAVVVPLWPARDPGGPPATEPDGAAGARTAGRRRVGLVGWFSAMYVAYLGVEAGLATWIASHLADLHWSEAAAARWTAAFWLAFTVGRFAIAPLTVRIAPHRIVRGALAAGCVTLVIAQVDAAAPWAFVLTGVAVAPVFPTGLVWLARVAPEVRSGTTYVLLSGSFGAAALPALVGVVAGIAGIQLVPTVLLVFGAASLGFATVIARRTAPSGR